MFYCVNKFTLLEPQEICILYEDHYAKFGSWPTDLLKYKTEHCLDYHSQCRFEIQVAQVHFKKISLFSRDLLKFPFVFVYCFSAIQCYLEESSSRTAININIMLIDGEHSPTSFIIH